MNFSVIIARLNKYPVAYWHIEILAAKELLCYSRYILALSTIASLGVRWQIGRFQLTKEYYFPFSRFDVVYDGPLSEGRSVNSFPNRDVFTGTPKRASKDCL